MRVVIAVQLLHGGPLQHVEAVVRVIRPPEQICAIDDRQQNAVPLHRDQLGRRPVRRRAAQRTGLHTRLPVDHPARVPVAVGHIHSARKEPLIVRFAQRPVPVVRDAVARDAVERRPRCGNMVYRAARAAADALRAAKPLAPARDVVEHFLRPIHEADAALREIIVNFRQILRQKLARVALAAGFADADAVNFIVADLHDARLEHVDDLVHHVEQQLVAVWIRRAVGVGERVVAALGKLRVCIEQVIGVTQRRHLRNDLHAARAAVGDQLPHGILRQPAPAAVFKVDGVFHPSEHILHLVGALGIARHFTAIALPAFVDLRMALVFHRAADL